MFTNGGTIDIKIKNQWYGMYVSFFQVSNGKPSHITAYTGNHLQQAAELVSGGKQGNCHIYYKWNGEYQHIVFCPHSKSNVVVVTEVRAVLNNTSEVPLYETGETDVSDMTLLL